MEISEILSGIELTDDQVKALDKFFEDFTQQVKDKSAEELREIVTEEVKADLEITREDAEKAFELFEADCEKAFELFEADCDEAFGLFEADAEKAADLMLEDVQKEYTENMTKALQDVYEDIEARVKSDVLESQEMKALNKIKEAVSPILLSEDQKKMLDEIQELRKQKEEIAEEKAVISREKIIETLMRDFPTQYEEQVRGFISKAKDEDEIYERFNTIVEMIDIDSQSLTKKAVEEEEIKSKSEVDGKHKKADKKEAIKSKSAIREVNEEAIIEVSKKDDKEIEKNLFDDEEEDLINLVFAQALPARR